MTNIHRPTALLDANVLASITLTDIFVQLAVDDVFHARWTAEIHREWIDAVLRFRPSLDPQRLERRRRQMDAKTRDALVTGYGSLIDDLDLPDLNDRHVLAAAIQGSCEMIVTMNLKDFPSNILSTHNIVAQHPDVFLANLMESNIILFCAAIRRARVRPKNPPYTVGEYLENLTKQGLVKTVFELRQLAHLLE